MKNIKVSLGGEYGMKVSCINKNIAIIEVSAIKTHPFVPGVVTICDISDRTGRVQCFGMSYQGPEKKNSEQDTWVQGFKSTLVTSHKCWVNLVCVRLASTPLAALPGGSFVP